MNSRKVGAVLFAVAIATALLLMVAGCCESNGAQAASEPEPSSVIRREHVRQPGFASNITITEFRDSAGRICVVVQSGDPNLVLDCGYPRNAPDASEILPEQ